MNFKKWNTYACTFISVGLNFQPSLPRKASNLISHSSPSCPHHHRLPAQPGENPSHSVFHEEYGKSSSRKAELHQPWPPGVVPLLPVWGDPVVSMASCQLKITGDQPAITPSSNPSSLTRPLLMHGHGIVRFSTFKPIGGLLLASSALGSYPWRPQRIIQCWGSYISAMKSLHITYWTISLNKWQFYMLSEMF